mgnify:FL=1
MKKIILLTLLALITLCSAEELKVTTLEVKKVNYENGNMGATVFRVVCINGYKWLQYEGMQGSISQMFQSNVINGNAQPIQCKNQ